MQTTNSAVFSVLCGILKIGRRIYCSYVTLHRLKDTDYCVGVPKRKQYKLVLNSDDVKYGGAGEKRPEIYKAVSKECDGKKYSFAYPLPAYGVAVFEF